jgi:hypothetical protein
MLDVSTASLVSLLAFYWLSIGFMLSSLCLLPNLNTNKPYPHHIAKSQTKAIKEKQNWTL